jgi:hypothetical protein
MKLLEEKGCADPLSPSELEPGRENTSTRETPQKPYAYEKLSRVM